MSVLRITVNIGIVALTKNERNLSLIVKKQMIISFDLYANN